MAEPCLDQTMGPPTALHSMRKVVVFGVVLIGVFFGGLGGWAAVAPLESAAIAPGVLSVESNRKIIQHLEGGIVDEILVREGDQVSAGQLLVRLDRTQAQATLQQLRIRHRSIQAFEARLLAERDGHEIVRFPQVLQRAFADDSTLEEVLAGEVSIFEARRRSMRGQESILKRRIAQYEKEIEGLKGQIAAEAQQIEAISTERVSNEELVRKKLSGMQRLLELQRDEAEIRGSRARHVADIARAQQGISEEQLKIIDLETAQRSEVVASLREAQTQLFDLSERIHAASDVLARTQIHAPLDGVVVDLQVHTVGGVIAPGAPLMDVVPVDERLVVQAQVTPEDIDSVHPGLQAQVAVTAFSRRNVPPIEGRVRTVSADRLTDPRTGLAYFVAEVELPEVPYPGSSDLELYPGMQAEVMIVTGEHTPLNYILRPAIQSFNRALREN